MWKNILKIQNLRGKTTTSIEFRSAPKPDDDKPCNKELARYADKIKGVELDSNVFSKVYRYEPIPENIACRALEHLKELHKEDGMWGGDYEDIDDWVIRWGWMRWLHDNARSGEMYLIIDKRKKYHPSSSKTKYGYEGRFPNEPAIKVYLEIRFKFPVRELDRWDDNPPHYSVNRMRNMDEVESKELMDIIDWR